MLNLSIKQKKPLSKKIKSIEKAVEKNLPFGRKPSPTEILLGKLQQYGLYVGLFLAGYLIATIQNLIS